MTEIPAELIEAQRDFDAAHAEVERLQDQLLQAQDRAREAGARHRLAWQAFNLQVERQARELAAPPEERGAFLQGLVDKLTGRQPAAERSRAFGSYAEAEAAFARGEIPRGMLEGLRQAFRMQRAPTLPPELCVADGPVPSPNPEPHRAEGVRRPLPGRLGLQKGEVLWRDLVPDGPHTPVERAVGRDWLLRPAQPPATPAEWLGAAALAVRNAWQTEIRNEDGSFRDGVPDQVLGNELSHLIAKVNALREQLEQRPEGGMVEGVQAAEVWTIGQKPRTDGTHAVHLGPGVQAALVEALAPMHVWGTHASGRPLAAGERLVWVDREASTEGLQALQRAIGAELERRSGDE